MRHQIIKYLPSFFMAMLWATTPSIAQSNDNSDCPTGPIEYCYCTYENALEDLKQMQGNDQTTIKQRVSAVKKALDQCISRSSNKVTDDMKKM